MDQNLYQTKPNFRAVVNSIFLLVLAVFFVQMMDSQARWLLLISTTAKASNLPNLIIWLIKSLSIAAMLTAFGLKVILYAGSFGCLAEFLSGQEMVLRLKQFKNNVKLYWGLCLKLSLLLFFIQEILIPQLLLFKLALASTFISIILEALIIFFLAFRILSRKYASSGNPVNGQINPKEIGKLLAFATVKVLVTLLVFLRPLQAFNLYPAISFLNVYLFFIMVSYSFSCIIKANPHLSQQFTESQELFLIAPTWSGLWGSLASLVLRPWPPFFVVLKALTSSKYKIREFNSVLWRNWYYSSNKLVAITCYTANCHQAYKIAQEFKKHGSTVIMGGPHVSAFPQEALTFCNSVVIGEAEGAWQEVLNDYKKGQLKPTYHSGLLEDFWQISHKQLIKSEPIIAKAFLETTRGCKFNCEFCSIPEISGQKIRHIPIDKVIEVVKKIKDLRGEIFFLDNNIFADPHYARELFKALTPLKIRWRASSSIDIAQNDEDLKLAYQSGLRSLLIGYEIADSSNEAKIQKFTFADEYLNLSRKIKKTGIRIKAHFILGFDSDTWAYFFQFLRFCFKLNPDLALTSLLTPLPQSRLFNRLLEQGRITNLNWQHYDLQHRVSKPLHFSPLGLSLGFNSLKYFIHLFASKQGRKLLIIAVGLIALFLIF